MILLEYSWCFVMLLDLRYRPSCEYASRFWLRAFGFAFLASRFWLRAFGFALLALRPFHAPFRCHSRNRNPFITIDDGVIVNFITTY